jgi:hypothetical protein
MVAYTIGSNWDMAKQPHEQSYFKEHSMHLSTLRKSGAILAGARAAEKGLIILRYQISKQNRILSWLMLPSRMNYLA